ncbi:MAG: DUF4423 domain-containing protein [Bdellovibrionales bacterium]
MHNQKLSPESLEIIRTAIQRTFIERCKKNKSYSLRAYAHYLEIDQSNLSKILKGQKGISADFARSVSLKIGLRPGRRKNLFKPSHHAMAGFLTISDDEIEVLGEWYHFAILELAKTDGFVFDCKAIACRLGLHVEEVRNAIQRLQRLGFVRIVGEHLKVLAPNTNWGNTRATTAARKKYQRTLIEKSLDAIDHIPFSQRYNGSHTVAINPDRLPEFKRRLEEIREELAEFLQADGEKGLSEVYQFTFALFPLTKQVEE